MHRNSEKYVQKHNQTITARQQCQSTTQCILMGRYHEKMMFLSFVSLIISAGASIVPLMMQTQ